MMIVDAVAKTRWLVVAPLWFVLSAAPVYAVSLGKIDVESKLYEPFRARVALRGVSESDLENLRVSLADEAAFQRVGLARPLVLSTLKFKVVKTGARRGYVKITSHERVREPSLSFVVEAASQTGRLQRRYDVLLDLH